MIRHGKILALALVSGLALMQLTSASASTTTPEAQTPAYTEVTLTKGTITKDVVATGSLRYRQENILTAPEAVTLDSIAVGAGEVVTKGQVLAQYDTDALADSLKDAKAALTAQDDAIVQLLNQQSSDQSIKTAVPGVVKQVNLSVGQMVQSTLQQQPAAIISADGLMKVAFVPTQALTLGLAVQVKVGGQTYTGSVARLQDDGNAVVAFPDTRALIGDTVQVLVRGTQVGEGQAEIDLPYLLYTQVDGVVSEAPVKVNRTVTRNTTLFTVENAEPGTDYTEALATRDDLAQRVSDLEKLLAAPTLVSESDGVVATVTAKERAALQKGDEVMTVYAGSDFALDVTVDELDILSLQTGQTGVASLDAITDAQLPVKVETISLLGSNSNGITNYAVTLTIQADERLRSGMNGTATLIVGEVRDSVLVPLAALMSDRGGNYVLLKDQSDASADEQGIKTYVKVGLSDDNYGAVTEGLSEGDVVLVRASAMTGTQTNRQMQPGFGMMPPDRQFTPGEGRRRD